MTPFDGRHPGPGALVALHFGEAGPKAETLASHVAACAACGRRAADLAWAEALVGRVDEEPPADGLARVLAAVGPAPQPAAPRPWGAAVRTALPSAGPVAAGAAAIRLLGPQVLASGRSAAGRAAAGVGPVRLRAALLLFAAGSLVTLAVAPFLILEGQSRALRAAPRTRLRHEENHGNQEEADRPPGARLSRAAWGSRSRLSRSPPRATPRARATARTKRGPGGRPLSRARAST